MNRALRFSHFGSTICFTFLTMIGTIATAHDGHTFAKVQPAEIYRPTAMPDRIILTLNGDPRNSVAVTWRTSTEITAGLAEITIADAGPYFSEKSKQVAATTTPLVTDINSAHFHTVAFTELQAGTKYVYRVGDGTNWSEWFHFRTAAEKPEPFSFIYFGDAQNNLRSLWSRVVREAYSDAPKAAFLLHAGDLINSAEADAEWGEWFGAGAWINAMMPNLAVPGNHEQAKTEDNKRRLTHHWRPQFELPLNGPPGLEEACFTITYQDTLIVCLDSNKQLDVQAEWLDKVLSENESKWVVCCFHHPIFSTAKDRDNAQLRELWKPVIDKHKVDLVLQGHDHTYGRTGLHVPSKLELAPAEKSKAAAAADISSSSSGKTATLPTVANVPTGVQQVDPNTGTVYVVSVSGPKMYNNLRPSFMPRVAEDTQLYQIIHIDGDKLRFEARTAIGELYDAFELYKNAGQTNKLQELPVAIPQRLRSEKK